MPKRLSQESVIATLQSKHPSYDFSRFVYNGNAKKSVVICPKHGEWEASYQVLKGHGCAACYHELQSVPRIPLSQFIEQANKVHNNRYDYSKVVWRGVKSSVTVICAEHGEFATNPYNHVRGTGCKVCGRIVGGNKSRVSQEDFIARAKAVHGDRYDLSKVVYTGQKEKIIVTCRKHGDFHPSAGNFTGRKSGCRICSDEGTSERSRHSFDSYVKRFRLVHGRKYNYTSIDYTDQKAFITAVCKTHGNFRLLAQDHLRGFGCAKCSLPVHDQESFIEQARRVHGDKYDYSQVIYIRALAKVNIVCPSHGVFSQQPSSHVNSAQGCPRCALVGPSKGQMEVASLLEQYVDVVVEHPLEGRLRIDVFLPKFNIGVEYHGLVWHSTRFSHDPLHIIKKHRISDRKGIRLIHIYSDEWLNNKQAVENMLLSLVGALPRIYARNCTISSVNDVNASAFYDLNHIQMSPTTPCKHF